MSDSRSDQYFFTKANVSCDNKSKDSAKFEPILRVLAYTTKLNVMTSKYVLRACLVLLAISAAAQRLPQTVTPESYKITLAPDFNKDNFRGEETIQVKLTAPSTEIVLNSAEIVIQEADVSFGGTRHKAEFTLDIEKQEATLTVSQGMPAGDATIHIRYTGTLNNEMRGFYLGKDDHGRKYAATQFESTDARRAFPCFDEPAYKATFEVSIVADKGLTAIANSEAVSDTAGLGNKHTVRFAPTQKISSYLVAFAVGNFEYLEGSADGIPIRVYTVPGKKNLGQFALEATENFLQYFDRYFGIKYPYGKLDLIGLPDFSAGAMENVGLITFREVELEVDDKVASLTQKKDVAITISHEIAHEWFGDLVTMQWWDDVWLNEGFATWMEAKPIEAWKPEWHVLFDEISRGNVLTTLGALNIDSLASTRPIHQRADTPGQIEELFDGIAYGKSAAVLRMVEAYLGPETFRIGVNAYLKEHANGNATAADFSVALAKASGKPVDKVMDAFVLQPGVPLVSVKTACIGNATQVSLTQQRFFYDRPTFTSGNDQLWQIPVCLKTESSQSACQLLTKREENFSITGCPAWVMVDGGGNGFYRSGYDSAAIRQIARAAESALTPIEKMRLLSDEWALVRVGEQSVDDYLILGEGMKTERTGAVMDTLYKQLEYIGQYLVQKGGQATYQAWIRTTFQPLAKQIGWESSAAESQDIKEARASLLEVLGTAGADPSAVAEAQKLAHEFLQVPGSIDGDLATTALAVAASQGDSTFYDEVLAGLKTAKNPEEYYRYFHTLPEFNNPQLVERTLQFAVSPEVRSQDALGLIIYEMAKSTGQKQAWDFVRSHWAEVQKAGGPFAGGSIQRGASYFCDAAMKNEAQDFFAAHPSDAAERTFKQSMEKVQNCIDLKAAQSGRLAAWLEKRGGGSADTGAVRSQP